MQIKINICDIGYSDRCKAVYTRLMPSPDKSEIISNMEPNTNGFQKWIRVPMYSIICVIMAGPSEGPSRSGSDQAALQQTGGKILLTLIYNVGILLSVPG